LKRPAVGIFVVVVLTLPVITTFVLPSFIEGLVMSNESATLSYTPHAPIYIYDDNDFESQGWPGAGNPGNPYRISGFNFTYDLDCIVIEDTTAHFVIEDCYIGGGINDGITLDNVTNGVIRDTVFGQKTYAVYIDDSRDCQVTNVTFINCGYKVYLRYCENIHVYHCTFEGVSGQGIYMDQDTGSVIEHNNMSYQDILIWDSADTNISHNVLYHDKIQIQNCNGLTLLNNSIDDVYTPGFDVTSSSQNCVLENNRVHNPYDYAFYLDTVDNIILRNNTVTKDDIAAGAEPAFYVVDSNDCTLERNSVALFDTSYRVHTSTNIWVLNNTAYRSADFGIHVTESEFVNASLNSISSNVVISSACGILFYQTEHSTIDSNEVIVHEIGLYVTLSNYTSVHGNTVYDNELFGILISGSIHSSVSFNEVFSNLGSGIRLTTCETSLVSDNTLYDNEGSQMYVHSSDGTYVYHNNVSHAIGKGIELSSSMNCSLVMNTAHEIWGTAIYIHDLDNFTMVKNKAYDNLHDGLHLRYVDDSLIESMTTYNHQDYGIRVELCTNISLPKCISYNNGMDDLLLYYSENCSITSSTLGDRGLKVAGDTPSEWEHTVSSTTVTDGPVVYLFNELLEVYDATTYGQLFLVNCSIVFVNNGEFSNHSSGVVVAYSQSCTFTDVTTRNCTIGFEVIGSSHCAFDHCSSYHNYWNGFELHDSPNNQFSSCIMYGQLAGISAETSPHLIIDNCDSYDNAGSGFEIIECDFSEVTNCTSYNNFNDGVSAVFSNNCTIEDNYVHHSGYGVRLINCANASVESNNIELRGGMIGLFIWESIDSDIISNNVSDAVYAGIDLKESTNIYVDDNRMINCGLLIEGEPPAHWSHEIGSNTVNGKPLGVFTGINSATILNANDYGQLFLNYSIHVEVHGSSFTDATVPIIIYQCEDITVSDVTSTNGVCGVIILNSDSCILQNFTIQSPRIAGVFLYNAIHTTLDDVMVNSTIDGIFLQDSDDSNITNCIVTDASQRGYYLLNTDDSILDSNVAYNNTIGFYLWYSLQNNFTRNGVFANGNGFYIQGLSDGNLFLENEIGWNTLHNAIDDVEGNKWDNGFDTGNAWSDYISGGYYEIHGVGGAVDGFPTTLASLISEIEGPDHITFWLGISTDVIQWNVTARYASHYVVLMNGSEYQSDMWDGMTPIVIELDDFAVGFYNFTLYVYTLVGIFDSDSVSVTVLEQEPTTPTTPITEPTTPTSTTPEEGPGSMIFIIAGGLGVVVFLLIVVLFKKKQS
jgi:parallel beta-helix repeat protein